MNAPLDAYVLKTVDYKESSKLLYLYSEHGKKSAIARGVKKMNSPHRHLAQSGTLLQVSLSQGALPTLKEANILTYFPAINNDLIKRTITNVVQELIYYNTTEDDDHLKLFGFLKKWLHTLEETKSPLEVLMVFELKFLYLLGYGLAFNRCAVCKEPPTRFDPDSGMITCHEHDDYPHRTVDLSTVAPIKYYLHLDITQFKPLDLSLEKIRALMQIIDGLYSHYLSSKTQAKTILHTLL